MRTWPNDIVVVDVETTGLCPERHAVIEIGAVALAADTLQAVGTFETRVRPHAEAAWDPEAQAVHGIDPLDLLWEPDLPHAVDALVRWMPTRAQLAGWNVAFDAAHLRALFLRAGREHDWRRYDYHPIDVWTLYEAAWVLGAMPRRLTRLDTWCSWRGVDRGARHNALEDAALCADALRVFVREVARC